MSLERCTTHLAAMVVAMVVAEVTVVVVSPQSPGGNRQPIDYVLFLLRTKGVILVLCVKSLFQKID